jgi:GPH family glycoside/pentoside/hexuronide:cation symporter
VASLESAATRKDISSLRTKLFYGFGSVAFGVKDQGFATFLLFFYNQVFGASPQLIGGAIAVALFFDAFADPIVGQISDNLRSRWGRRHPFMYASAIPVALAYFFLWNPPHLPRGGLFFYLVGIIIVVRTFITMYEIPSSALVAELTPDYDQRTSFLGYRYLFGWLGGLSMTLLAYGVFFVATKQYPIGQLNPAGYVRYSIAACAMMVVAILVSSLGTHKFIPGFNVPPKRSLSLLKVLAEMLQTVRNRSFIVLTVSALFSAIAAGTLGALNSYFNTFLWGLAAQQIFFLTVIAVIGPVIALFLAPAYSSRVGKKPAAISLWILATVFYWFPMAARLAGVFPPNGDHLLIPLLAIFQTTGTMFSIACSITISSMLADVVEDSQRVTGRRSEGLFFSANAFVLKAVSGMGILVATQLLAFVHFPTHADPAHLDPQIIKHLTLAYFPTVFVLYAVALGCLGFYRISRTSHEENVKLLAAEAQRAPVPIGPDGVRTGEHLDPAEEVAS